jgi:integrase
VDSNLIISKKGAATQQSETSVCPQKTPASLVSNLIITKNTLPETSACQQITPTPLLSNHIITKNTLPQHPALTDGLPDIKSGNTSPAIEVEGAGPITRSKGKQLEQVKSKRLQIRMEAKEREGEEVQVERGKWATIKGLTCNELPKKSLFAAGKMWSNEDLDQFMEAVSRDTRVPYVNSLFLYKATRSPQVALEMLKGMEGESRILIPLWIRSHWLLAAVNRVNNTIDFMDSESSLVTMSEIKEIATFISAGLNAQLAPQMLRSLLQESRSVDCGLFAAINSILWTRGMLPKRQHYHTNRRIEAGRLLSYAEMYANGEITIETLVNSYLTHIATLEAPLLTHADVLAKMDFLAAADLHHIKVGWVGYKEENPTLIEWSGVLVKRHQKTWKVSFQANEAPVWAPKQDITYIYVSPDEEATITATQEDRLSLKEVVPFNSAQVEGDDLSCAQVIEWLTKATPHSLEVEKALARTTRQKHRAALASLRNFPQKYALLPLPVAIATYVMDTQKVRRWRHSTALTNLATFQGALRLSPLYLSEMPSIIIKSSIFWKLTMRAALHNSVAEVPDQPLAITAAEVNLLLKNPPPLEAPYNAILPLLEISWLTAARIGDALQLTPSDISFAQGTQEKEMWQMNVRFRRGKTARRGQYVIAQPMPSADTREYILRAQRENQFWLFPAVSTADLTALLRTANPRLESRSIRRGRLQHLSKLGCSDVELLHVSRHANIPMLRRYLSFGIDSGENSRRAARIETLEQQFNERQKQPSSSSMEPRQMHHHQKLSRELSHSWETGSESSLTSMSSM